MPGARAFSVWQLCLESGEATHAGARTSGNARAALSQPHSYNSTHGTQRGAVRVDEIASGGDDGFVRIWALVEGDLELRQRLSVGGASVRLLATVTRLLRSQFLARLRAAPRLRIDFTPLTAARIRQVSALTAGSLPHAPFAPVFFAAGAFRLGTVLSSREEVSALEPRIPPTRQKIAEKAIASEQVTHPATCTCGAPRTRGRLQRMRRKRRGALRLLLGALPSAPAASLPHTVSRDAGPGRSVLTSHMVPAHPSPHPRPDPCRKALGSVVSSGLSFRSDLGLLAVCGSDGAGAEGESQSLRAPRE